MSLAIVFNALAHNATVSIAPVLRIRKSLYQIERRFLPSVKGSELLDLEFT